MISRAAKTGGRRPRCVAVWYPGPSAEPELLHQRAVPRIRSQGIQPGGDLEEQQTGLPLFERPVQLLERAVLEVERREQQGRQQREPVVARELGLELPEQTV